MENLKIAATSVANGMQKEGYQFDPSIILVIIELISQLLPILIDGCDETPVTASGACANILQHRDRPYRIARRACRQRIGWFEYYQTGGDAALDAILREGKNADPDLIERCYCEIKAARSA